MGNGYAGIGIGVNANVEPIPTHAYYCLLYNR